jgi:hypothetical protein
VYADSIDGEEFVMKRKYFLVLIPAVVFALVFTGCPQEPKDDAKPDARLVNAAGSTIWTNSPNGEYTVANNRIGLLKTFSIDENYEFTTGINVVFLYALQAAGEGADPATVAAGMPGGSAAVQGMAWEVKGKLVIDDGETYRMKELTATGTPAQSPDGPVEPAQAVAAYENEPVRIHFSADDKFEFTSAINNNEVTQFFGGTYTKITTP